MYRERGDLKIYSKGNLMIRRTKKKMPSQNMILTEINMKGI
jgi:hypothetical protein